MIETSLPNLHPLVVHFPVALVPVALVLELCALLLRRRDDMQVAATTGWVLAALGATAAYLAGRAAADGLVGVPPDVQPLIGEHSDWALRTLVVAWAVAAARVAALAGRLRTEASWHVPVQAVVALAGVGLLWLLFQTADRGGALVYAHALAVVTPACPACPEPTPASGEGEAEISLVERDGILVWRPGSRVAGVQEWPASGLPIAVDKPGEVLLPVEVGDVQVDAWLDLTFYDGEVSLVHHAAGGQSGAFTVSTSGPARLDHAGKVLDEADQAMTGEVKLAVSASGNHLKGLVDGETLVHGHAPPLPDGQVGLSFDGHGVIVVDRVEVTPLVGH